MDSTLDKCLLCSYILIVPEIISCNYSDWNPNNEGNQKIGLISEIGQKEEINSKTISFPPQLETQGNYSYKYNHLLSNVLKIQVKFFNVVILLEFKTITNIFTYNLPTTSKKEKVFSTFVWLNYRKIKLMT